MGVVFKNSTKRTITAPGVFLKKFAGICCLNAYVKFLFGNVLCVINVIVVMAVSSLEKGLNKPKYWQRD